MSFRFLSNKIDMNCKAIIAGFFCALYSLQTPSALSQSHEMVPTGLRSVTTVGLKPDADPDSARQEFQSIGIELPANKLCSINTILSTPDRNSTMHFVEALHQSPDVTDVDYTYSDQHFKQFNERMLEDTDYLKVRFRAQMTVAAERDWLKQNFPQLKNEALEKIDQPYIFSKCIATNKDGVERQTQGALDNPWYAAMNFTFQTVDAKESTVPIAKIQALKSVRSVKTISESLFKEAEGPPAYMDVLASRIRRAWFPALRHSNLQPMTVRVLFTPDGELSRLRFARSASARLCNSAACKAILDALNPDGIDLRSVPLGNLAPVELEVLFYDGYAKPDPAPRRPVIVRLVDVPDDGDAPGWFAPGEPIP